MAGGQGINQDSTADATRADLRYLSVCSGIEAASVAWHPLGWEAAAFSEIEKFPRAVLRHHYPHVPLHGDFTTIGADEYGPIDLLVGGTPCQSFSVAGLRGGLADDRGNLALEFLRLAQRTRARWVVWENVPGVLSSAGGRDFGSILGGLVELGYGFAYRVLDAQFFGVAQRRRRVFVVGHLGNTARAAAVLFERHCLQGNPAPRRQAGERIAGCLSPGAHPGGFNGQDAYSGQLIDVRLDDVDGVFRNNGDGLAHSDGRVPDRGQGNAAPYFRQVVHSPAVAFDTTQITSAANYSNPQPGDPCHPLAAGAHAPAIAFGWQNSPSQGDGVGELVATLDKSKTPAVAFQTGIEPKWSEEIAPTLTTPSATGGGQPTAAMIGSTVRRLTPRECERLQGFPDDYTLIPYRGKPAADCPDGPRYKALGNSMAVPCMAWIGQRIQAVEALNTCPTREDCTGSASHVAMSVPADFFPDASFHTQGNSA